MKPRLADALAGARTRLAHPGALLWAWGATAGFHLLWLAGDLTHPGPAQLALELSLLGCAAFAHLLLAPEGPWRSALWPPLLLVGATALRAWPVPRPEVAWLALALASLLIGPTRGVAHRLLRRVPAPAVALLGALSTRAMVLDAAPERSLLQEPLQALRTPDRRSVGPSIVLVTVDTLRADAAQKMRSVRRLAARGRYFPRAMAASSWTVPSLATLLTGLPAEQHGAVRMERGKVSPIARRARLLPEQLAGRGYRTAAFVTNPYLARRGLGFWRGFDTFRVHDRDTQQPLWLTGYPHGAERRGEGRFVIDGALGFLETVRGESFFLWVHLFDPHLPYDHAKGPERYDVTYLRRVREGRIWSPDREAVRAAYAAEVAYVDRQLGRLLDALEARDFMGDNVVVLSSDHGEELFDHGGFEHGHSHHGEVMDVPLVLVAPGLPPGVGQGVASLQDVAPTLRAIAGLPPHGLDLRRPIPAQRLARASGNLYYGPARSLRKGHERVIVEPDRVRHYHLGRDPEERAPTLLSPEELDYFEGTAPAQAAARSHAGGAARADGAPVDVQTRALRSLGYAQ